MTPTHHGPHTEGRPRCWACNTPAPQQNRNEYRGWVGRWIDLGHGRPVRELYCVTCFAENGFPDWAAIDRDWGRNNSDPRARRP